VSKHCRARTKASKPCKAVAVDGGLCAFHADPKRAAQLGRIGGSKNRRHPLGSETEPLSPPQTAKEVKDLLAEAMAGILRKQKTGGSSLTPESEIENPCSNPA
jgi:hypothetical protein